MKQSIGTHLNTGAFGASYMYFLLVLFSIDLFFIVANYSYYHSGIITNEAFTLGKDFGYAEIVQYCKELAVAVLLFKVFQKTRDYIFVVWSAFFSYLLFDDSIQIHEKIGNMISHHLVSTGALMGDLRMQDFGEMIVSAVVGVMFLLFFIKYFYKSSQATRTISYNIIAFVTLLLFFGVFIDIAHMAIPGIKGMGSLEDGGEMIAMSLLVWYAFNLWKSNPNGELSILNTTSVNLLNTVADSVHTLFVRLHLMPNQP